MLKPIKMHGLQSNERTNKKCERKQKEPEKEREREKNDKMHIQS